MSISTETFVKIATSMPETVESSHMGTADFRVAKKIFATLKPEQNRAVLKLSPELQQLLIETQPDSAVPVNGSWGEKGWTQIHLDQIENDHLERWMQRAWFITAPTKLQKAHPEFA